jgi:hypothetical protein
MGTMTAWQVAVALGAVVAVDLAVTFYCFVHIGRSGRRLDDRWQTQHAALDTVRGALERLVAEADERAAAFERLLGEREERLRRLLLQLAEQEDRLRTAAPVRAPGERGPELAAEVARLAGTGLEAVEIARRLGVDPAQVRVILDLGGSAGSGRQAAA